jgi:hypothetical protein
MTDIKIVDKIIPQGYADQIEADVLTTGFPWFYINDVTNPNYGSNSGFVHPAFDFGKQPSDWHSFIRPMVYGIEEAHGQAITQILRIRVGLLTQTNTVGFNTPHVDFTMGHFTACYYVNDSDGDTVMFDQRLSDTGITNFTEQNLVEYVERTQFTVAGQSSPKKGRVCIFDGTRFHASTKPNTHDKRVVITVNFI